MAESSDEENGDDGRLSPRTMLAIQEALAEEGGGSSDQSRPIHSSLPKQEVTVHQPAPQVVVSSSEDEADLRALTMLPSENPNAEKKLSSQNVHMKDSLLVSSSEDEVEEAIAQRNDAFRAILQKEVEEKEVKNKELQPGAALNGSLAQRNGEAATCLRDLPISTSAQICVKPFTAVTENGSGVSEQKTKETNEVKLAASDDSESEGTTVLD